MWKINKTIFKRCANSGFTLIELLVSIMIMAVLSAGVVSLIGQGPKKTARDSARKADMQKIASALELYRTDNSGYPQSLTTLTTNYLSAIPNDPSTNQPYTTLISTNQFNYIPLGCVLGMCKTYTLCVWQEKLSKTCADYSISNP